MQPSSKAQERTVAGQHIGGMIDSKGTLVMEKGVGASAPASRTYSDYAAFQDMRRGHRILISVDIMVIIALKGRAEKMLASAPILFVAHLIVLGQSHAPSFLSY